MNTRNLFVTVALLFSAGSVYAQTGAQTNTPFGSGEDSIRCRQNISLFTTHARSGNFQEAYDFWLKAYEECPASTKNIYIYGVRIAEWRLQNEQDPAKRQEALDMLLKLYDDRAKYFGDDPKYGLDFIMASKVSDYMRYMGDQTDYNKIYSWIKPAIDQYGQNATPRALFYLGYSSLNKAIKDEAWHDNYVKDYTYVTEALDKQLATADDAAKEEIQPLKTQTDELFALSGLADCETLVRMYGDKLEANKTDTTFLKNMLGMFHASDCENHSLYFQASKYLFAVQPSATAAMGLAKEAMESNRYDEASKYLQQAISLSKSARDRAACNYTLGLLEMRQGRYASARTYCNKALAEDASMGDALILIAQMYAATANSIFPGDAIKARCVYYLAVDKLQRAKTIDPSCAPRANRLIGQYSRNFPSPADVFMHPDLEKGKSLYIGGWIGESTVIR
ncbi:tetratricopeptide repeat protein [Porphyromonas loveana]|uniref:tetratricopeptide repeat protein n=1 Tax=Porphyromonas loveana TaxID=1884669 RepID=UPI0035A118C0